METTEETESDLKSLKEVRTSNYCTERGTQFKGNETETCYIGNKDNIQFFSNSMWNGLTENLKSITSFKDFKSKMNQISFQQKCCVTYVLNE